MSLQFGTTLRTSRAQTIADALNAGAGAGLIAIYDGTKPATVGTALSGNTLLAKLVCSDPAEDTVASGVLTLDAITQDASADATGTATWFRAYSSDDGSTIDEGNAVMQGTVTATGGGGDMTINTTSIVAGGPVSITSAVFTEGGA